MKERPILFIGDNVRAILEDRKNQTRRIGKCQIESATELGVAYHRHATRGETAIATYRAFPHSGTSRWGICECPQGIPHDRLWVKETFQMAHEMGVCHKKDTYPIFRATDPDWGKTDGWKWKPSIFMPRRASRITLEITAIRVERLQDISEADAIAEGVRLNSTTHWATEARDAYRALWESINGKGSWDKNPWVWVIEFKKI